MSINELIPLQAVFNTLIPRSRSVVIDSSVGLTVVQLITRMTAPVELATRYTTPDTTVDIDSMSVTVE